MPTYEITQVPFEDRGPIASFQLDLIDQANPFMDLNLLDQMDLLVMIETDEGRMDGAAYLYEGHHDDAVVGLYWVRDEVTRKGRKLFNEAIDQWAKDRSKKKIHAFCTRIPTGFQATKIKLLEREIG